MAGKIDNNQNKSESAPQGGALSVDVAAIISENDALKEHCKNLEAENKDVTDKLSNAVSAFDALKTENDALKASAPAILKNSHFEVIKSYDGIEAGALVESSDKVQIAYMVKEGYWKASK